MEDYGIYRGPFKSEVHTDRAAYIVELAFAQSHTADFVSGVMIGREGAECVIDNLDKKVLTGDDVMRIYQNTFDADLYDRADGTYNLPTDESAKAHGFGLLAGVYEVLERNEVT